MSILLKKRITRVLFNLEPNAKNCFSYKYSYLFIGIPSHGVCIYAAKIDFIHIIQAVVRIDKKSLKPTRTLFRGVELQALVKRTWGVTQHYRKYLELFDVFQLCGS